MGIRLRHIAPVPGSPGTFVTATGWPAALLALLTRHRPSTPPPTLADVLARGRQTRARAACGCHVWRLPLDPARYVPHRTDCPTIQSGATP